MISVKRDNSEIHANRVNNVHGRIIMKRKTCIFFVSISVTSRMAIKEKKCIFSELCAAIVREKIGQQCPE